MNHKKVLRCIKLALVLITIFIMAGSAFSAEVYLVAEEFVKTMPDGTAITMWGFAPADMSFNKTGDATSPGPPIVVPYTDTSLTIHLRNNLSYPLGVTSPTRNVSIVIPGQTAALSPARFTDSQGRSRVYSLTHETAPGEIGTYTWDNIKPGTYLYHSGTHPAVQVQMGLYGAMLKDAALATVYGTTYENSVVLFYSEIDPDLHGAVQTGTYGTADYPSPIDYKPKYFLINGEPYTPGQAVLPVGLNQNVLLRFLNAGLDTHVPALQGFYMKLVAEDGNPYPYQKEQYSVLLPAGQTVDAVLIPTETGTYPLYDRRAYLINNNVSPGGMLTYLEVRSTTEPVAVDNAYAVNEDGTLNVVAPGVLAGDSDPDADPITAVLAGGVSNGTLNLNPDGSFTYVPNANFNGGDFFTYRAFDSIKYSNTATVNITVNPLNDPPSTANDSATTFSTIPIVVNVLANDSDIDGDALFVSAVTQGTNGSVVVNPDNTVTYRSNTGFAGTDSFSYTASDGIAESTATVTVTVNPVVNTAPVARNDYPRTRMNTAVIVTVLANDTDREDNIDPATVSVVGLPSNGTAVANADGTVMYTPRLGFRGSDTFTYTVADIFNAVSNLARVRVNVVR